MVWRLVHHMGTPDAFLNPFGRWNGRGGAVLGEDDRLQDSLHVNGNE